MRRHRALLGRAARLPSPTAIPFDGHPAGPAGDTGIRPALFGQLVPHVSGRRRKTLHNASRGWLDEGGFERAGIDPMLRPDTLAVVDFVQLASQ